jgi:hypothetical protein
MEGPGKLSYKARYSALQRVIQTYVEEYSRKNTSFWQPHMTLLGLRLFAGRLASGLQQLCVADCGSTVLDA